MSLRPRDEIANLQPCPHGGINYAELRALGLTPASVLDFSVCTNPFMPPPGIKKLMNKIDISKYPDSEATELRERLAQILQITPDNILVGSGTTELIRLIALTYLAPKDPALIAAPTYGDYEVACRIAGAEPITHWAGDQDNFSLKVAEIINSIRAHRPRAIFICNPNNPTGQYLSRREVDQLAKASRDCLLIIDEAYLNFVENSWPSTDLISRGNVVLLRSLTKDYGLAGLRLGYAIASREIINNLRQVCPPWNVNTIAQKIGAAVLDKMAYREQSQKKVSRAKQFLIKELTRLGFLTLPSETNYFLVKVGSARQFRTALLKRGILVRDGTSFGLPEYVRIAPRTLPECRQLITAIESVTRCGRQPTTE